MAGRRSTAFFVKRITECFNKDVIKPSKIANIFKMLGIDEHRPSQFITAVNNLDHRHVVMVYKSLAKELLIVYPRASIPDKTQSERKARYVKNMRDEGFVRMELWVHPSDRREIIALANKKRKARRGR